MVVAAVQWWTSNVLPLLSKQDPVGFVGGSSSLGSAVCMQSCCTNKECNAWTTSRERSASFTSKVKWYGTTQLGSPFLSMDCCNCWEFRVAWKNICIALHATHCMLCDVWLMC